MPGEIRYVWHHIQTLFKLCCNAVVLEETPFLWFHRCFGWILFLKCLSQKRLLTETAGPFQFNISLWTIAGPRLTPHAGTRSPRDPRASHPLTFTGAMVDRLRLRERWIDLGKSNFCLAFLAASLRSRCWGAQGCGCSDTSSVEICFSLCEREKSLISVLYLWASIGQ